jgi:hypothetical protein
MVTTIAGVWPLPNSQNADGPYPTSRLSAINDLVVAPNGVLFVADTQAVRRVTAAPVPSARGTGTGTRAVHRSISTLIGRAGPSVEFARSSAPSFRSGAADAVMEPYCLALYAPRKSTAVEAALHPDPERDVGRLFVGYRNGVFAFDLQSGEKKRFDVEIGVGASGLAVTEDGARLFAVYSSSAVYSVDTRTGVVDTVRGSECGAETLGSLFGCLLDPQTRSLICSDHVGHRIVRLRGIDIDM